MLGSMGGKCRKSDEWMGEALGGDVAAEGGGESKKKGQSRHIFTTSALIY